MAKTILIADDNPDVRGILKMTLKFKGYNIIEAEDGKEAFEILQKTPCDLLVSDIDMPNMQGPELLVKVRQELKNTTMPVIICTGEKDPREAELLKNGANRVMKKPFSPIELMQVVEKLI